MGTSINLSRKLQQEPIPNSEEYIQIPRVIESLQNRVLWPVFKVPFQVSNQLQNGQQVKQAGEDIKELLPDLEQDQFIDSQNIPQLTYCPGNCGNGYIFEVDDYQFSCSICKKVYCLKCRNLFHQNTDCDQLQQEENIPIEMQNLSNPSDVISNTEILQNSIQEIEEQSENSESAAQQSSSSQIGNVDEYWHCKILNLILKTHSDEAVDIKEMFADCFILALQFGRFQSQDDQTEWVPYLYTMINQIQICDIQYVDKIYIISKFINDFAQDVLQIVYQFYDLIGSSQMNNLSIINYNFPIDQLFTTIESQQNNAEDLELLPIDDLQVIFTLGVECGRNAQNHAYSGKDLIQTLLDLLEELVALKNMIYNSGQLSKIRQIMDQLLNELIQTRTTQLNHLLNRQCPICLEKIDYLNLVQIETCSHIFHRKCLEDHVDSTLQTSANQIKCPQVCSHILNMKEIQMVFADDKLEIIQELLNKRLFQQNPEVNYVQFQLYSICPSANCNYAFIFEGDDNFQFLCPICLQSYCLKCRVQYHFNMTCAEFRQSPEYQNRLNLQLRQDNEFQEFVRGQNFKQCPKCTVWVERISGCLHMTCHCKYEFCYRCGGRYGYCPCGG